VANRHLCCTLTQCICDLQILAAFCSQFQVWENQSVAVKTTYRICVPNNKPPSLEVLYHALQVSHWELFRFTTHNQSRNNQSKCEYDHVRWFLIISDPHVPKQGSVNLQVVSWHDVCLAQIHRPAVAPF